MSWFEQDTSNTRRVITQFHRPVKLKLKRTGKKAIPRVPIEHGVFIFLAKGK